MRGKRRQKGCWKEILRNSGNHFTDLRATVIEILEKTEEHLTAKDIYIQAHSKNPSIGLTTVYRTLELLCSLGFVQKFEFGEGKARYEMIDEEGNKNHHHHLVCVKCNLIIDYTDFVDMELELINKTEKALSAKHDFEITGHMIRFYGLCSKCKKII
jgi:Fur family ferric uptake transcriptional regulator